MAVTVGQTIGEAEYTTLRGGIVLVMGTPTGTGTGAAGYNESITSSAVSPGDKISATDWNNLKTDIDKAYTHQVGSAPNPALATVNTDSGITKTIHDALETATDFIKDAGNRFTIGSGQSTTTSASSRTKTDWNGTQIHDITFTWASANAVKAFFNAGGKLVFSSSLSYSGTEAKTLDWKSMAAGPGVVTMGHVSVSKTGATGTVINDGYYDLDTTARYLVSKTGTSPYSENDYQIEARSITNGVRIRLIYRDDDTGDQVEVGDGGADGLFLPLGPAVDENVQGTLTSALSYIRPTGSNVQTDAPTIALGATNTFT
jgi:hypothetical protein